MDIVPMAEQVQNPFAPFLGACVMAVLLDEHKKGGSPDDSFVQGVFAGVNFYKRVCDFYHLPSAEPEQASEDKPSPGKSKRPVYTYFVHSLKLEAVKIGKSVHPVKRIKDFGTANPDKLTILGTIEGDREDEFHKRFGEYRINPKLEWFSMGPALMDFLEAEFRCVISAVTLANLS